MLKRSSSFVHVGSAVFLAVTIAACGSDDSQRKSSGHKDGQAYKGKDEQMVLPPKENQGSPEQQKPELQKPEQQKPEQQQKPGQQQTPPKENQGGKQLPPVKGGKPVEPPKEQTPPKPNPGQQQQIPNPGQQQQQIPNPGQQQQQKPVNPGQQQQTPVWPGQQQQQQQKPVNPGQQQQQIPGLPAEQQIPGMQFPQMPVDGGALSGPQYITHLQICINAEPTQNKPEGYQVCTDMFGADQQIHFTNGLNIGDNYADLHSIGLTVTAMSVPGAAPITALDLCINAEGRENGCTGYSTFTDGTEHITSNVAGDRVRDVMSAGLSAQAYSAPTGMPMARIKICVAGESAFVCTADVSGNMVPSKTEFSFGDTRKDLQTIGLKFSTLSFL